jgi:hypothetical protein
MTRPIIRPAGWVAPFMGIDLTGKRFARLAVIARAPSGNNWQVRWLCVCDCGSQKVVASTHLRRGLTKSCGCYMRDRNSEVHSVHGKSKTQEHAIWCGMLTRCSNPSVSIYYLYGGRGISVCEKWKGDFLAFFSDMGPRPSKRHSVERRDPNGNYEPGNCYWATRAQQVNNRRCTRFVEYRGRRMALTDAVRAAGSVIHYEAAWIRIKTGWTPERALETPRLMESPASEAARRRRASRMGVAA